MIEKIISSGQTGAATVALDVAVKLGLDYGGWCREGEPIQDKYRLKRLPVTAHKEVTEKTIAAAQGSLVFTEGGNGSLRLERIKKTVLRLNKPLLVLNLARESGFSASRQIAVWIAEHQIAVLHVDGEDDGRKSFSAAGRVANILEATFFLTMMDTDITSPLPAAVKQEPMSEPAAVAETVAAALDHLEGVLSLKDRATIANMAADELVSLQVTLGEYINTHFDLFRANSGLLNDCRHRFGQWDMAPENAAAVVIRALWERLRATCRIRIVK